MSSWMTNDPSEGIVAHDRNGNTPETAQRAHALEQIKRRIVGDDDNGFGVKPVRKAKGDPPVAVYNSQGQLIGTVDPDDITALAAGKPAAAPKAKLAAPAAKPAPPMPAGAQPDASPASLAAAPVAKASASGSEAEFRRLGAQRVRKGLATDPRTTDTLLLGAIERVRMTPTARRQFDDGLKARFSLADRTCTVRKLRSAIAVAKAQGWTLNPVSPRAARHAAERAQELRVIAARRGTVRG
jgi:hypothetical protein